MKSVVLAVACFALPAALAAQEWIETRFDRVHLRNGNFIDGRIIRKTPLDVTVQLPGGELTIRYTSVDRIELIKTKSLNEKPLKLELPPPVTPKDGKVTAKIPTPEVKGDVRKNVTDIVRKWRAATKDGKYEVMKEMIPLGPEAATFLLTSLDSFSEPELQLLVEPVVVELKPSGASDLLIPALGHAKSYVRGSAAVMLAGLGEEAAIAPILSLLKDPESSVRGSAIGALHKLKAKEAIEPLIRLGADPVQEIRNSALAIGIDLALKNDRSNDIVFLISNVLETAKGDARADIALMLGRTGRKEAAEPLIRLLGDENANARSMALVSLSNMDAREASNDVVDRMRIEEDSTVKVYLTTTADKLKIRKSVPYLIAWMEDPAQNVSSSAAAALRSISNQNLGIDPAVWKTWWDSVKGND